MGACGSSLTPEQKAALDRSREIERENTKHAETEAQVIKLLLLGAGESGKSTIFKQMKILYGKGFSEDDRAGSTPVCHNNAILAIKTLLEMQPVHGTELLAKAEGDAMMQVSDEAKVDKTIAAHIKTLWADPGIQATYFKRGDFQLIDSAKYFFKNVDRLAEPDYVASIEDLLHLRVRTSGIVEERYTIDGADFSMYDVGGQRNERKKWIHCFQEVTAVIFVAAISEYDQMLYEDNSQNRMDEALELFGEICNSPWFRSTAMILFLNKRDLFEEKIDKVPIRLDPDEETGYPGRNLDYEGGEDIEAGKQYFDQKFHSYNLNPDKDVYSHCTCATDTRNVAVVFNACKDIILKGNLADSGFMD